MFVLYLMFLIEKNWRSQNLSEKQISRKKNSKKYTSFEEKKVQGIFAETFILALLSSAVSSSTDSF